VKVRYGDFTTLTRRITVEDPLTEAGDLHRVGCFSLGRKADNHPDWKPVCDAKRPAPSNATWLRSCFFQAGS
jgi:hypothetical protein